MVKQVFAILDPATGFWWTKSSRWGRTPKLYAVRGHATAAMKNQLPYGRQPDPEVQRAVLVTFETKEVSREAILK